MTYLGAEIHINKGKNEMFLSERQILLTPAEQVMEDARAQVRALEQTFKEESAAIMRRARIEAAELQRIDDERHGIYRSPEKPPKPPLPGEVISEFRLNKQ